jgi:hypothetical protein
MKLTDWQSFRRSRRLAIRIPITRKEMANYNSAACIFGAHTCSRPIGIDYALEPSSRRDDPILSHFSGCNSKEETTALVSAGGSGACTTENKSGPPMEPARRGVPRPDRRMANRQESAKFT